MKWTKEEVKLLKKNNYECYGNDYASYIYQTNWLYHTSLTKLKNGEIEYNSSYPINVDCDDSSYDMEYEKKTFKSLKEYLKYETSNK
jgi:hypothetical protein